MTKEERHLWYDFLRTYPIRFLRQKVIDNYIVDFYCHKARLVIEIDGFQHYTNEGKLHDAARTQILEQYGISVLRFANSDIEQRFEGVCHLISKTIQERIENAP